METPLKFVITIMLFWMVLGGLFTIVGMDDYLEDRNPNTSTSQGDYSLFDLSGFLDKIGFIWDYMTFNIYGIPQQLRASLTLFLTGSLSLSIYVLLRSGS